MPYEESLKEATALAAEATTSPEGMPTPSASIYNIYGLGITIVIGGQIIYWNLAFKHGFFEFLASTLIVGSGYVCLTCCLAEMTSILPFAGGSYGYVRCTVGPFTGFVVGCCEAMEYVLYVATAVAEFGQLMSYTTAAPKAVEPLFWILFYAIALAFQVSGGKIFWLTSDFLAISTTALIVVYLLSVITVANFEDYAITEPIFSGSIYGFLFSYPLASWFFVGVEAMTLSCESTPDPTNHVPKAMVACVITLFVSALCILFATASSPPGLTELSNEPLPLSQGYVYAWNISMRMAAVLAIPGTFSTAYGFMFAYGRQLYAMSCSKLLPKFLSEAYGENQAPASALLFGSLFGLAVLLLLYYTFSSFSRQLFNICMLGSCSVYVSIFCSFIICSDRYSNMERQFVSPFGKLGAYYGIFVFSLMTIALAFFQEDNYLSVTVFGTFIVIVCIAYRLVVRKREFFSIQEQKNFWKAYLLNANVKKKRLRRSATRNSSFLKVLPWPLGHISTSQRGSLFDSKDNNQFNIATSKPFEANTTPLQLTSGEERKVTGNSKSTEANQLIHVWTKFFRSFSKAKSNSKSNPKVSTDSSNPIEVIESKYDTQPIITPYSEEKIFSTDIRPSLERHFLWDAQRIVLTETQTAFLFPPSL